jgi:hypothetical protein
VQESSYSLLELCCSYFGAALALKLFTGFGSWIVAAEASQMARSSCHFSNG